jgi:superfamily I DNA/RNA helicase
MTPALGDRPRSAARDTPPMRRHPAVDERLARLQEDQRRAATAPPGPVLCVAPAGSGKTTTLIGRIAWLVDEGVPPASICALTFNRRAAEELRERLSPALSPLGAHIADRVRIRTFHALGLEVLREAGALVDGLVDRDEILRAVRPDASVAERRRLDTVMSRFKLDLDVDPAAVSADPDAGPVARTYAAYEAEIARRGGLDFDDLVARSLRLLSTDSAALRRWRERCAHLLVDEAQDLDRSQLRLALLLAAPENRIFLVGDDDQSIYGWRLADVRRLLGLAAEALPGLTRVDLETNYRCPAPVLKRSVRLIEHNHERFAKTIRARENAVGALVLAPSAVDDLDRCLAILRSWSIGVDASGSSASGRNAPGDPTFAILARTNRELLPAAIAALTVGVAFRAPDLVLPIESADVDDLLAGAARHSRVPVLAVGALRTRDRRMPVGEDPSPASDRATLLEALTGWAAAYGTLDAMVLAVATMRAALGRLRRDDARLTLATAHGTKGLEFDHVAVIGLDEGRFPSARSIADAVDPDRALAEERRLAYVAWTRARRSLTLVYDPGAPSQFLREAFDAAELRATYPPARDQAAGARSSR